jgi:hypothetical protein
MGALMKNKLLSLVLITLIIATSYSTIAQPQQQIQPAQQYNCIAASDPRTNLDSITLNHLITLIKDNIQNLQISQKLQTLVNRFINRGVQQLQQQGITLETPINNIQTIEPLATRKRSAFFLINYNPDSIFILTSIEPYQVNLSDNQTQGNQTLEILIKIMPFLDYVQTEQLIILRKLYQSTSLLWPAIGIRILEDDTTVFILMFGPGIQRSWRLL